MTLQTPPLYKEHQAAGADFTGFGGWEMPVTFDDIRTEHTAVRDNVGLFDVSHMSEVVVSGPDATALMDVVTTNTVRDLTRGDAQYSCILDEDGVILDDTVVYQYPESDSYLFVPNAGHGEQMARHWSERAAERGLTVTIENKTEEIGLIAVQGPNTVEAVESVASDPVGNLSRFTCKRTEIADVDCLVARTGYTGEDGVEIFFPVSDSEAVWEAFAGVQPCGLGARDTLRLEAGLLLSGQDFDPATEPRTPLEAGLEFVVDFSKDEFVGRDALCDLKSEGVDERMVGLRIDDHAIARHGYTVLNDGSEIGHVTSGTMSPTFNIPIAMGYVEETFADRGTEVEVAVRERRVDATVVSQRFLESIEHD